MKKEKGYVNLVFLLYFLLFSQIGVVHERWAEKLVYALNFDKALTLRSSEEFFGILTGGEKVFINPDDLTLEEERPYVYTGVIHIKLAGRYLLSGKVDYSSIITIDGTSYL